MTTKPRTEELDEVWRRRFEADRTADIRSERRLFIRAIVIALVVAALAIGRWRLQ